VFDRRKAFTGKYAENTEIPIRVEAAAYRGKLVNFEIVEPWTKPEPDAWSGEFWFLIAIFSIYFGALFVSAWLAVRNIRMGRSDITGALKVAIFLFALRMICWIFETHHVASFDETDLLIFGLQSALFWAVITGFMYLAFEPYLRKSAPERVVAWSRLLAGDLRDPLIGRDLLIGGAALSILLIVYIFVAYFIPVWTGKPPSLRVVEVQGLSGITGFPTSFLDLVSNSVVAAFIVSFLLLFFSLLLRRKWLGTAAVWSIAMVVTLMSPESGDLVETIGNVIAWTGLVVVTARFGVLASISFIVFTGITDVAFPPSLSVWYAGNSVLMVLFLSGLAIFGFYTSTAGQWQGKFLEE
jgi:serine/threonine-protein kinase